MAISFPGSKSNGQKFTAGNKSWTWNGASWKGTTSNGGDATSLGGVSATSFLRSDGDDGTTGSLGVGTTSPGAQLHVYTSTAATAVIKIGSASAEAGINFDEGTTNKFQFRYRPSVDRFDVYNTTLGSNVMSFKDSGNIGIGTTSPGHKLDVVGGSIRINDVGQYIYFGTNASVKIGTVSGNSNDLYLGSADDLNMESNYIRFWRDGYYGSTEYGRLAFSDDSWLCTGGSSHYLGIGTTGPSERLHVSGNILATGNIIANSDISLKDNITPIPNALDKVLQIRGVTYNRNDIEDNPKHVGVIAQEVEKVLPEVVSQGEDGIKSVAYGNMVSLLIEAIKEQQEQIDMLKEKLESK